MKIHDLAKLSTDISSTRSRNKKRDLLSDKLSEAFPNYLELFVYYMTGQLPQGRIGVGPAMVRELWSTPSEGHGTVSLPELDQILSEVSQTAGAGSKQKKMQLLGQLFSRCNQEERAFLSGLLLGEMRQGALDGVFVEAIAMAGNIPAKAVRRAVMIGNDMPEVARIAMQEGLQALTQLRLKPLIPVQPMLAQPVEDIGGLFQKHQTLAAEIKMDGVRVQVHKLDTEVKIYTRALHEVSQRLPEVVELAKHIPAKRFILDGEVLAFDEKQRPLPFQVTMQRFGKKTDVDLARKKMPLHTFFFDVLFHESSDLLDLSYSQRRLELSNLTAGQYLIPQGLVHDSQQAIQFFQNALATGHEGIMLKTLEGPYEAGARGAEWLKVKHAHTLDLVILAAEWGSGRRKGLLSNLHLGARTDDGSFVMLGKTFKGLTDKMLKQQTEALLLRETHREEHVVFVRPELLVEIAVNEIQTSKQYPAGMALRFARVKHFRFDKPVSEADHIDTVSKLYRSQQS